MIVATMGLIGAGKSTLTNMLREKHGYTTFMEPTSESEGASDNPFLEDYYKNPRRWAFTMQAFLLFERYYQQGAHGTQFLSAFLSAHEFFYAPQANR